MSLFLIARLKGMEKEVQLMAERESGSLSFSVQVVDLRIEERILSTWEDAKELLMRVSGQSLDNKYIRPNFVDLFLECGLSLGRKSTMLRSVSQSI
ncbi:hypothetical protein [Peribacillus deserti]|uniref:Uncharacterized protein n=1 Tax=Peribacillus deserti TaxID=673318 RepID=A0A2N5M6N8_9BACI|nr:hypothetical protein [Peribacillus deserti]PLT30020.1 hypothetical protein CUU66_09720 [Peribacillus deserti]